MFKGSLALQSTQTAPIQAVSVLGSSAGLRMRAYSFVFCLRVYAAHRGASSDLLGRARKLAWSSVHCTLATLLPRRRGACKARAARALNARRVQGTRPVVPDQDEVLHLVGTDGDEPTLRLVGVEQGASPLVRRKAPSASSAPHVGQPHAVRHPPGRPTVHQRQQRRPHERGMLPPEPHGIRMRGVPPLGPLQNHHRSRWTV